MTQLPHPYKLHIVFKIKQQLIYKPVNSFGILKELHIVNEKDQLEFDHLFNSDGIILWEQILEWSRNVRNRFKTLNIDELFDIKFNE